MTPTSEAERLLPHPITGQLFASPVPPGTGWPDDPATATTPVARSSGAVAALAREATLEGMAAAVSVCRACPRLVEWRERVAITKRAAFADQPYWGRPVPGLGDPRPRVLIVGLAPAAHGANRTGRLFTGDRSGDFLFAALHRAGYANQPEAWAAGDGLVLTGVRMVAGVRCAPPGNAPSVTEKANCAPWLDRELDLVLPSVESILCLGQIAWAAVLGTAGRRRWATPERRPVFGHGAEYPLLVGAHRIRVVGSYHVSQQNTFTGRLTPAMLDDVLARL